MELNIHVNTQSLNTAQRLGLFNLLTGNAAAAAEQPAVDSPSQASPAQLIGDPNNEDIRNAIGADGRFQQRSLAAIQKELSGYDREAVAGHVAFMVDEGYLTSRVNRNGVRLYRVD
jgi:hypothetical protein